MYRARSRAFTLIELMVVVAIVAIISAILIPSFIRTREQARKKVELAPPRAVEEVPSGVPPVLASARLELKVEVMPLRVGLDVANRYLLDHRGHFLFQSRAQGEKLMLFPFPKGSQIENLTVRVRRGEDWVEPEGVVYRHDLVAWKAVDFPLEVRLDYQAGGNDSLVFEWPRASKMQRLEASLKLEGGEGASMPLGSLRPTGEQGRTFTWEQNDLLVPAPIVLEFSAVDSPLGRVGTLFRLTGLALLLFGAGFWYLGELYQPGCLKDFGFGSFSLLALTYCSFFVSVAVLGFDGNLSALTYLGCALLLSQPLLIFHVAQLIDGRFAWTRALPWSLATLLLVLMGVYLEGSARNYGYLGFGLMTMAFLTTTYRPFRRIQSRRGQANKERLTAARRAYEEHRDSAREVESQALLWLARPRGRAESQLESQVIRQMEELRAEWSVAPRAEPESYQYLNERLLRKVGDLESSLTQAAELAERNSPAYQSDGCLHCLICGTASAGGAYCCGCGGLLPEERLCSHCQQVSVVPLHLLEKEQVYHCHGCGA